MRSGRLLGFLLAGAGLWIGCAQGPSRPLHVEYAGCAEVYMPGPVCVPGEDRRIRLWVDVPPVATVEVGTGGWWRRWQSDRGDRSEGTPVAGGRQLTVEVPSGAQEIAVRSRTSQGEAGWSLVLGRPRGGPGVALSKAARAALRQGDHEAARSLLARSIAAHRAAGSLAAEIHDATLLAWIQIQQGELAAARRTVDGLRLPAGSPAEALYDRGFHRGLLADHVGDARAALGNLQDAVDLTERVGGMDVQRRYAEQVKARQLQALGRSADAERIFAGLRLPSADAAGCGEGLLLVNHGWAQLLAGEAGEAGEQSRDPTPLFERARDLLEDPRLDCAPTPRDRLNLRVNLALAHLQHGRPAPARAFLDEARSLSAVATPLLRMWWLELEARLALTDRRPETALPLYDELDRLAAAASSPEGRWRAADGRARCHQLMGQVAEALASFARAESLLDLQSRRVPIGEGRETFVAQREAGTRRYLGLLLAGGRIDEALEVVRHARSRVLRQLARGDRLAHLTDREQRRWDAALAEYQALRAKIEQAAADAVDLPADQLRQSREQQLADAAAAQRKLDRAFEVLGEVATATAALPRPAPGELLLAYHPLADGWVAFADDGQTVEAQRFDDLPAGASAELQAARLIVPFAAQIRNARQVRMLPYGALREIDFHALPFDGDILLAALPVAYGLDLAPATTAHPGGRRALIVADPLGNLPEAAQEARIVDRALRDQRPAWSVTPLVGSKAGADAVRRALVGANLFHYAGHGIYSGFGGWESVLPLAGETRLTLGDLLALGRVPPRVVLSGCETGRSGAEAPIESLGLAQAFVLAGARTVIAPTRPIADRAAHELVGELYRRWDAKADPAVALQQAQLAWRRNHPTARDWAGFRLFVP